MPRIISTAGQGLRQISPEDYNGPDPSMSTDSQFYRGLNSAVIGGSGLFGDGASALMTEALKAYEAGEEEAGRELEARALQLMEKAKEVGPRVSDVRDVNGLRDATDWVAGAMGSGAASLGQSVVGGLAGAGIGALTPVPGGALIGGAAGTFGAGYGPAVDEQVAKAMLDEGIRGKRSAEEILDTSRATGAVSAALDSVGAGVTAVGRKVLTRAGKQALGGEVKRSVADDVAEEGLTKYVGKRVGESIAGEAATGGAQSVVGQLGQNELSGREGIDWGDVAADAAAEGAGGALGGAPAVAQGLYGKALGTKNKIAEKSIFERAADAGEVAGQAAASVVEKAEVALAKAVKPTASDPDFFNISQPVDPKLTDEEIIADGENRVQAAARLAAKLRDNKGAPVEERELGVKFEADMAAGDPDAAVKNLREGFAATQQKQASKGRVTSILGDFVKGKRKANAMELPDSEPDDMDQLMSIWQEKMADGDSAFADTLDDSDVKIARRGFAEWIKNDFRDPDSGRLFIPRGMAETLGKKAGDAVKEAFALMRQQGLVPETPERADMAQRMEKALAKLGERSDTSLKMIKDSFTPIALRKIGPANLDQTATQVQAVMQKLASGQIEMTPEGMSGLVELFGSKQRAKDMLRQFKEGSALKESQSLEDGGISVDNEEDGVDTGIGGDLEEVGADVRTVFHGPFDLKDEANRGRLAKRLDSVSGAAPSAKVREVGVWDKLKAENNDPDALFAAEQGLLTERGVDLNAIDDGTRTRMLKKLNESMRFVEEASLDDSDKLDRVDLKNLRVKKGYKDKGVADTAEEGRIYLEREVEVDDPDGGETITEDGEIVKAKKVEKRAFLTSTSKLLAHANRSRDKLTNAEGSREAGDKMLAALGAVIASGKGFTGRIGVRPNDAAEIQWQDDARTLPANLRLYEGARFGDARYSSSGSKPATSLVEDVSRADLRDMNDDDLNQFIEDTSADMKGASPSRKKYLQSMLDYAQDLLDDGPGQDRTIDNPESMAEPFRLNEERPAKPVERGADGNVAAPEPSGKLATGTKGDEVFRPMVGKKASRKQVERLIAQLRKGVPALMSSIKALPRDRAAVARQALVELSSMDPRDERLTGQLKDFDAFQKRVSAALRELGLTSPKRATKYETKDDTSGLPEPVMVKFEKALSELVPAAEALDAELATLNSATGIGRPVRAKLAKMRGYLSAPSELRNNSSELIKIAQQLADVARARGLIDSADKLEAKVDKAVAAEPKPVDDKKAAFIRKLIAEGDKARETISKLTDAQLDAAETYVDNLLRDKNENEFSDFGTLGNKKLDKVQDMMLDELSAREDAASETKASKASTGKQVATPEEIAAIEQEILDTLGDKVKVSFLKKVLGDDGKRVSGLWDDAKQLIKIALNAKDPLGVGRHEAMHALFSRMNKAGVPAMQEVLERVASTKAMQGRLRRLLQDHPKAIEQLSDPEEAAAYMYQFWRAGMLELGPKTESFFGKVLNWLRDVTRMVKGEVRDAQHAEQIMTAFSNGDFAQNDAALQAINEAIKADVAKYERNLLSAFRESKALKKFVFTASAALRDTENPHLIKLANQFETQEGATMGKQSYFDAVPQQQGKWLNALNNIFRDADPEDAQLALKHLQAETLSTKINDPVVRKLVDGVRAHLDAMHDYMLERNVERWNSDLNQWEPIPKIKKNYFPRVWDVDTILDKTEEFGALLMEKHAEHLDFIAEQAGMEVGDESRQKVVDEIVKKLTDSNGQADITESNASLGITPFQRALNRRSLNWIDPALFEPFMSKDLAKIMTGYTVQAVKRAEYVSRFGNEGERIQQSFDKAFEHEIAEKDAGLHFDILDALDKSRKEWVEQLELGKTTLADEPTFKSVAMTQFIAHEDVTSAMRKLAIPIKAVLAAEGTLGREITDKQREVLNYITTYQNFRLLALSLFTSMSDIGGIVVRGGTLDDAYQAFTSGIREVIKGWRSEATGDAPSRDALTKLAEKIGTVDAGTFMDSLGQMNSSQFMEGKLRNLNNKLFKWNGMEAWNRAMRVQATGAAARFIERHLNTPGKHSKRYLEDELGLRDGKDAYMKNGRLDTDNEVVQQAIVRWVNGAILRPNAMQRPIMASDPHYQLFYHLKQFTYSFHKVILARAYNEAKEGNYTPTAALLAGYVPIIIAADIMKEMLLPGDEPAWMKGGIGDVVGHGFDRAGLLGVPQMGFDAVKFAWKRGNPAEMSGLFGPAPDQVVDWLQVPLTEAHTLGGELLRAAPFTGVASRAATLAD
jgi:hypothetical protein